MAAHWPSATDGYAAPMNDIPKVVFSTTLERAEWAESTVARGDLGEEIARLKRETGGDIMAHGGAAFVQSLSRLGLIDEYRLVIRPVALSDGLALFKDLPDPLLLRLVEATAMSTRMGEVAAHTRSSCRLALAYAPPGRRPARCADAMAAPSST